MKKKIFRVVAIVLTILVFLMLLCTKINKISIIENIKQTIAKIEETAQSSNKVTIKDVTNLEDNVKLEHEHIYKTQYDETKHWEECTVCGEILNEKNHSYTNSWTMGSSNGCDINNVNKFICICGYSYESINGRAGHTMNPTYNAGQYWWAYVCTKCLHFEQQHNCELSNGTKLTCTNLGRCRLCGTNYANIPVQHYEYFKYSQHGRHEIGSEIYCTKNCSTYLGIVNRCELVRKTSNVYEFYTSITVPSGASFEQILNENYFGTNNVAITNNISRVGTTWSTVTTITFIEHTELKTFIDIGYYYYRNGVRHVIWCETDNFRLDEESPTIEIEKNSEELNQWSKTKPIVISGTENYCNTVTIKILDDENNIIFEGKGNVNSGNYSVTCVPQIECDTIGKTFKAIVTDNLGNSSEKEFTISKVDCIPPTPTSGTEILGNWAKSKDFTFTATDYGIGQVQVAFNDIEDLKLATEDGKTFSRDYKFIGDVYSPKQLSVMYKDGLGNTSIQKITIDKLDNTAPTITNTSIHNDIITVDAHDRHESLGEGSGIVKYRYIASEEKLTNLELTEENSTESANTEIKIKDIYKVKYIYIIAEDYVGNKSKVYEFKVPELILTSSVNLNTVDGKGEIILDWSSYDVSDKYFVVYRKKENQTEWEKIVPLTQKLTGSTYTDKLGNDEAKPDVPTINIKEDTSNNNINIAVSSTDNGTSYKYYIESYSSINNILLSKSNYQNFIEK